MTIRAEYRNAGDYVSAFASVAKPKIVFALAA
jgi:hypothetical protein